ncbi:TRAPP complex subunit Trs31 [Pseudohyphozyma bogoriensis]|nr:TRAPP complex subunit Trs31 [Pseudohyphozyma bogoriensis]
MSSSRDSVRDSIVSSRSTSSRFSSLLSPALPSSRSSTFPIPLPSPTLPPLPSNQKRIVAIYERPLAKSRGSEVALGAWAFLFSEIVQYTQKKVSGIGEFEKRLNILGYRVGVRLLELLPLRDYLYPVSSLRSPPPPSRTLRLLPLLSYVHSTLYRYLFNRTADSLEKSTENEDEYMIGDDDMVVTRGIEVPKEMSELSCGALVAGIVEAVMDGAGFPSKVTAHSVPTPTHPRRTVILIKLDPEVLARETAMGK